MRRAVRAAGPPCRIPGDREAADLSAIAENMCDGAFRPHAERTSG
jgi:hypothetical protein